MSLTIQQPVPKYRQLLEAQECKQLLQVKRWGATVMVHLRIVHNRTTMQIGQRVERSIGRPGGV